MAYDTVRNRLVVFGGSGSTLYSDTWEWDGTSWSQRPSVTNPQSRYDHVMAYDSGRQRVVLYGGRAPWTTIFTDTWEWAGSSWTLVPTKVVPLGSTDGAMAYDAARRRVVLVGAGGTWCFAPPAAPVTSPMKPRAPARAACRTSAAATHSWATRASGCNCCRRGRAPRAGFVLAGAPDNLALGGGCSLYVKGAMIPLASASNPLGYAETFPLAIPLDATLRGGSLYAQAVVVDPLVAPLGLATSGGLRIVLGD
jgi:hypothetical protein